MCIRDRGETTNPYGSTKAMMERILTDVQFANPEMSVTLLRYFKMCIRDRLKRDCQNHSTSY